MGRRFRRKGEEREIARRRITRLFALAHRRVLEDDPGLADRAVRLARRIAMRYQTGLSASERDLLCRRCHTYLAPGRTARVRVEAGVKRVTCLQCGNIQRRPYRAEQKERRRKAEATRAEAEPAEARPAEPARRTQVARATEPTT